MADDNKTEKVISIHGVGAKDGRTIVPLTPVQEVRGRGPVAMTTIQPGHINSGRIPASVTPLTPGQPATPAPTSPATGGDKTQK